MPCPKCGSKSAVVGVSLTTAMYFPTYRNDAGEYYQKGRNRTTTKFTCEKCGTTYEEDG